jgi:hypothetical protein
MSRTEIENIDQMRRFSVPISRLFGEAWQSLAKADQEAVSLATTVRDITLKGEELWAAGHAVKAKEAFDEARRLAPRDAYIERLMSE